MSWKDTDFGVSYGRDLPYYTLEEMKKSEKKKNTRPFKWKW